LHCSRVRHNFTNELKLLKEGEGLPHDGEEWRLFRCQMSDGVAVVTAQRAGGCADETMAGHGQGACGD
jgi:hypothetical protein